MIKVWRPLLGLTSKWWSPPGLRAWHFSLSVFLPARWSYLIQMSVKPTFICLALFSETSLVAQTVKHLSTMQETWVQSLGWEDNLEKEMAIHSSTILWMSWIFIHWIFPTIEVLLWTENLYYNKDQINEEQNKNFPHQNKINFIL